jgi:hypothetical protein
MNKKLKSIPKFRSEAEERRFWETHDSATYRLVAERCAFKLAVNDRDPLRLPAR